jgi:hypothetical protein
MVMWRFLAGVTASLVLSLIGVALATNFRGVTEWHARRSMSSAVALRRIPPWSWLPNPQYDKHLTRQVLLGRVIGAVFAAMGIMFMIVMVYSVLTGHWDGVASRWKY